jgi:hypothetical protein
LNTYQSSLKKQNKSTPSQGNKNTEKTSTHYKERPNSNHDYSDNILHTEGTESNKNKIILNGEDSKEYDILDSAKEFSSPPNINDYSNQVKKILIKDEEKISGGSRRIDKKIIENINNTINHNISNNLGFTLNFNNNSFKEINTSILNNENPKNLKSFDLNLENLPKKDFNEEFMEKYEEFSPSWRHECHKMKGVNIKKDKKK